MILKAALAALLVAAGTTASLSASDTGEVVDVARYANRELLPDPSAAACPDTPRALEQVKGNLYRHWNTAFPATHSGLVLITDEGALVIDPALTCTSTWLRDEIRKRFNVGVKYLIYTHAHFDHIAGAQVFAEDGATIVAHRNAIEPIIGEKLPVPVPNKVFDERMTITLGGETVELYHVAPSHSNSMILVLFPQERALQCTDICQSKTFPYMDFLDLYYDGWIKSLDWVLEQKVDIIDVGHYSPATLEDQKALRAYLTGLHAQVLALVRAGTPWDLLWRKIQYTDEQRKWFGFDAMRFANVSGMYRWVSTHRRGTW